MTVKLAKLFGSGSSNKSNINAANSAANAVPANVQQLAPPLPPPNGNIKLIKYCDHRDRHQPAAMTIYGHAYECNQMEVELEDDYDDNMSLSSAYMQRNHPYNNSQRPLLGERRPQVLLKKKGNASGTPMAGIPLPAPPLPPQRSANVIKSNAQHSNVHAGVGPGNTGVYVSPYVQQQKRDSAKGLHGFNDFDALSQQYNQHLQSPHIGYPYGSPPSPTAQSSDFCFDSRQRDAADCFKGVSSTSSTTTTKSNCSSSSAANGTPPSPPPRYGNVGYQDTGYYLDQHTQPQAHTHLLLSHASRFEDDFCARRNVDFGQVDADRPTPGQLAAAGTGPFIFGISHEQQQTDYGHRRRRCSIDSANSSTTTSNTNNSKTNSSSNSNSHNNNLNQPVINATSVKEHNALQPSLSDTSADSGKGAKFLLRKRKSKKTAESKAVAHAAGAGAGARAKAATAAKCGAQPSIKCVLVGDGAVGKTNLILSYLENRFNPEHVPTASDIYNVEVNVNESPVQLTLCDTAGQDTLDPLRELCYPDSDVFLLCFSVVKPETFGAIKSKWAPKFAKTKAALILVGTQADLRSNLNVLNKLQTNGEKPISYADAWDLATTIGAKYVETSSATQDKVKDVFDAAIWEGLVPTTLPPTPPFWKKLFCLA